MLLGLVVAVLALLPHARATFSCNSKGRPSPPPPKPPFCFAAHRLLFSSCVSLRPSILQATVPR